MTQLNGRRNINMQRYKGPREMNATPLFTVIPSEVRNLKSPSALFWAE